MTLDASTVHDNVLCLCLAGIRGYTTKAGVGSVVVCRFKFTESLRKV